MSDYITTIGNVADVYDGPHATPKKTEQGPYFLSISSLENGALDLSRSAHLSEEDFVKWTKRVTPQGGDVLFSYETRLGEAALMLPNIKACLGRRMGLLRPRKEKVIPEYLLYAYLSPEFQETIRSNTIRGATVDRIALRELPNFPILIPPKEKQRQVVKILKSISSKIDLNCEINQTLEQIAQAIFKSWFVDFDPVNAKIEAKQNGRDPERAAMCAISGKTDAELDLLSQNQREKLAATAALFPDELTESDLGLIPEGWEWSTIGKEVNVVGGGTPSTKNRDFWEEGSFNWTTPKDLSGNQDKILLKTERKITEAGLGKISSGLLPVDTVLLSSRAPVGYLALAKVPVAINQGYIAMKCEKRLSPVFVLQWANSVMDDIKQRASGTTFAEISKKNFRIIPVLIPTKEILKMHSKKMNCLYDKITVSITEMATLAGLRDTLLPRLLSGELYLTDNANV